MGKDIFASTIALAKNLGTVYHIFKRKELIVQVIPFRQNRSTLKPINVFLEERVQRNTNPTFLLADTL